MNRNILVIAGASGVGKTTVAMQLINSAAKFELVRSITTRAPRGDSHDGEYIYTDRDGFLKRAESGALLEYMEYGGNMYGTPISELERIFDAGKTPLLILDLEGIKSLRSREFDFEPITVYIWDDINTIEKRLYSRDLENDPTAEKLLSFIKRKEMNIRDYLAMPSISYMFNAFVRNETVDKCADEINAIFDGFSSGKFSLNEEAASVAEALAEMAKNK